VDAQEAMLKAMAKNMKVRASGQTRIIEVTVDSTDRELAANFANTLTNEFIDQNMEARWKMSQRTGDWLSRQLDDMRIKLERSEDALQAYARRAGLVFTGAVSDKDSTRTSVSEEKLRQVQQALVHRHDGARRQAVAVRDGEEQPARGAPGRVERQHAARIPEESYGPAAPTCRNVLDVHGGAPEGEASCRFRFRKWKRRRTRSAPRFSTASRTSTRNRCGREKLLTADYMNQARTVTGEGEKSIQYNILKREVDSNRQLYDSMLQRLKESSIAAAMKASNIRIVDAASAPKRPYKPNTPLNAALGLFGGIFLGIGFVIVRERADRTLQAPGDAQYWLNVPELGAIPSAQAETRGRLVLLRTQAERTHRCTRG
jgi:polysaccharide biosynthesis transport protein